MNQGTHPEELPPAEVLDDVAIVVGAEVTLLSRLPGGVNAGAMRVQLAGRANAVLKAVPRAHPNHLDETLRAQRVVAHMRGRGYPTPAWLGVGATATHVWHLMDFVDAVPAPELTPSLVEQLMEIIELQAGQASEPYDHWSYAWRVATGHESAVAGLSGYSSVVSALVERLRLVCADVPPPREAPDMVHADLNPSNVLVRDGAVVAVVDIGNAGSGTRATDLVRGATAVSTTFPPPEPGRHGWADMLTPGRRNPPHRVPAVVRDQLRRADGPHVLPGLRQHRRRRGHL
jgi:aminoglycoside phosphotransferase (APT) family kinase protein